MIFPSASNPANATVTSAFPEVAFKDTEYPTPASTDSTLLQEVNVRPEAKTTPKANNLSAFSDDTNF